MADNGHAAVAVKLEPEAIVEGYLAAGLFVRGTLLGRQPARSFKRGGSDETVNVRPKIGVDVNGEEVAIGCKDDGQMDQLLAGMVKGDSIEIQVEARPPFGARGAVTFTVPGVITSRSEGWK